MVAKNSLEYLLRVHLQTCCRLGELKDVECESAKMKNNKTNLTLNLILTLIITLTLVLS